jgi:hypothetical protein
MYHDIICMDVNDPTPHPIRRWTCAALLSFLIRGFPTLGFEDRPTVATINHKIMTRQAP